MTHKSRGGRKIPRKDPPPPPIYHWDSVTTWKSMRIHVGECYPLFIIGCHFPPSNIGTTQQQIRMGELSIRSPPGTENGERRHRVDQEDYRLLRRCRGPSSEFIPFSVHQSTPNNDTNIRLESCCCSAQRFWKLLFKTSFYLWWKLLSLVLYVHLNMLYH